jgi:hypothetical protein
MKCAFQGSLDGEEKHNLWIRSESSTQYFDLQRTEKRPEIGAQRQETKLDSSSLSKIHTVVAAIKNPGETSEAS